MTIWIKCNDGATLLNLDTGATIRIKKHSGEYADQFVVEHLMAPTNICTIAECDLSVDVETILARIAKLVKAKEVCG